MQHFTNRQITERYSVSFDAVRLWIRAAREGKNDLQVVEIAPNKWQIADTTKNQETIKELLARAKKHRNGRARKITRPSPDFYKLYSPAQQADIISSIESYQEVPLQYGYFNGGASYWDRYAQRLLSEQSANMLKNTIELLDANLANVDRLLGDNKRVNVIDLGVGNGLPVKGVLSHLLRRGVLGRYVGVDISPGMLDIARKNVTAWFDGAVSVETHVRDITADGFRDLLVGGYLGSAEDKPVNLVMLLGGTLLNLRRPDDVLHLVGASMMPNDLLVYATKLDTVNSRQYFDFNADGDTTVLSDNDRMVLDLLGIDSSMYDVDQFYDSVMRSRFIRVRMKFDVTVRFEQAGKEWQLELARNEPITLWRYWHVTADETVAQFRRSGFRLLDSSVSPDDEYLLTMLNPSIIKPNKG